MQPDDPRHGTHAGWVAHYYSQSLPACEPCRKGHARYCKQRALRELSGGVMLVSTLGAQRRIRALQAIGWSKARMAADLGVKNASWFDSVLKRATCLASTHERIAEMYDRLCMTLPPNDHSAAVARGYAAIAGHAPPMAWDDIDDRSERPKGMPDTA